MADKADILDDDAVSELPEVKAPESGKPQSVSEATNSIADLLGSDPDDQDTKAEKDDDTEQASKDPLGEDEEDLETDDDDKADPSPDSGGKFVAATAKYKLADGTVISVGDLARNNLFQGDYTKKTTELARERDTITKEKADVAQLTQRTSEERQYLIWFAENFAPKAPVRPTAAYLDDPVAHGMYQDELQRYQAFAESYRQFKASQDADSKRKDGETQQEAGKRAQHEIASLFERIKIDPQKDPAKAQSFFEAIESGAKEFYGANATQVADWIKMDHRAALVLRDAIRYSKNKTAAPKVQEKLKTVPKMLRTPTARSAPDQQQARALRQSGEKLRQTGSLKDGIAAIEALIS